MAAAVNGTVDNTTTCNPFDETELTWLSGTRGVAGAVCLILTILVLLLFVCIQPSKNFRLRILLFLTVSTFFYLIFFTMQASKIWEDHIDGYKILCTSNAFFIVYFGWQELLLVSSITVYLYYYFVRLNDIFGPRRQGEEVPRKARVGEVILYLILLLVPFIPAGLGFIMDGYGETRGWCWIQLCHSDSDDPFLGGILRQVFLWYFWCVLCGIVTLVLLLKIVYTMRSNARQHSGKADRLAKEFRKREGEGVLLLIYLGVFHAVNFIELVVGLISYAVPDNLFPLWLIYAVLSPLSAAAIPTAFLVIVCCCYRETIHLPQCRCNCNKCYHRDEVQPILNKSDLHTPKSSTASLSHTGHSSFAIISLSDTDL